MMRLCYPYRDDFTPHEGRLHVRLCELARETEGCVFDMEKLYCEIPEPPPASIAVAMEKYKEWSRQYA
jgi:hypothetical protein